MYTEAVMDHFTNPRNVGEIREADGVGEVGNPVCGNIMKIYIKVENERIVDIKFKTFGCVAAIATTSILTEMVKGKTIAEAEKITNRAVAKALGGLPPRRCTAPIWRPMLYTRPLTITGKIAASPHRRWFNSGISK